MLLLSAGSCATRVPLPASRRGVERSGLGRGPLRPRRNQESSLGSGDRHPRARAVERVSPGAAAAFARGRARRGAVATRAADEPPDAKAAEPADARESFKDPFDVKVRKKKKKKSDDDDDDEKTFMSDLEATRALDKVLGVHMNASAARVIARDFYSLGVDTPAKLRRMIAGKSFRLLATQALAVIINGVVALGMFLLFKNAESIVSGGFDVAAMNTGLIVSPRVVEATRSIVELLSFGVGGVFAVEAFAQTIIFGTLIANAFVFGFTDLNAFLDAVQTLARGGSEGNKTPSMKKTFVSVPAFDAARDAAFAVDATRRLASLRLVVDDAVKKTPTTANMSGVQRLGALLELSIAEQMYDFRPSTFALSESEAMRVASLFARFDDDADGFVTKSEVAALLRSAADSASVEVLDKMEWDPYASLFAFDDDDDDPGALAMAVLDGDDDGRVSLEEFVAWWRGGCPLLTPGAENAATAVDALPATGSTSD